MKQINKKLNISCISWGVRWNLKFPNYHWKQFETTDITVKFYVIFIKEKQVEFHVNQVLFILTELTAHYSWSLLLPGCSNMEWG